MAIPIGCSLRVFMTVLLCTGFALLCVGFVSALP